MTKEKTCSTCGNAETRSWDEPCDSCLGDLTEKRLLITNQMDEWNPINWKPRDSDTKRITK